MSKDIQLCGMGNGLVDIQYSITEEKMQEFGMKKGEMRLIDDSERIRLIKFFENDKHTQCSGGSAANSVIVFKQLGGTASYKTVLGNDKLGKFYADEFHSLDIILKAEFLNTHPTGTCFVFIAPDSERTMLTSLGATAFFAPNHIDEELIARSEWVYLEGYKFSQESSTEAVFRAVELAKKHNTKIAFTFSDVFIIDNFFSKVQKLLPYCDLVFCNENEAKSFTHSNNFEDAAKILFDMTDNVVLTKGPDGSKIKWENKIYDISAVPTNPVDTTGAGDMFAGAFLYGIINEKNPIFAANLASYCSSKIVSQFGARMNADFDYIKKFIKQNFE